MNGARTVSVVTPFYNTADYLEECIQSVLGQSMGDFEYVLLDNRSTDGSDEIARSYAGRDSRIRFFTNEVHVGQVENYNAALRLCGPDARHVKLVQADDWLFPNCLEEMVGAAERHPGCRLVLAHYHQGDSIGASPLPSHREVFPGRELARNQLLRKNFYFGTPTTVLYRGDHVRSRHDFYRLGRLHEDTDLCYEAARSGDIAFVHQILTGVRMDNPSIKARTRDFNTYSLDRVIQVESYADDFLEGDEAAFLRKATWREYYDVLAPRVVRGAEPGFWDYHRKGLETIGRKIQRGPLGLAVIRYLRDMALCPPEALRSVAGRLRRNHHPGHGAS